MKYITTLLIIVSLASISAAEVTEKQKLSICLSFSSRIDSTTISNIQLNLQHFVNRYNTLRRNIHLVINQAPSDTSMVFYFTKTNYVSNTTRLVSAIALGATIPVFYLANDKLSPNLANIISLPLLSLAVLPISSTKLNVSMPDKTIFKDVDNLGSGYAYYSLFKDLNKQKTTNAKKFISYLKNILYDLEECINNQHYDKLNNPIN